MTENHDESEGSGRNASTLVSRNITVLGRRTSVRLEPEMWESLQEIAKREQCAVHDLCSMIALRRGAGTSLTAAIRVFLMLYYRAAATDDGHTRAGHGSFRNMIQRARMTEDMLAVLKIRRNALQSVEKSHWTPDSAQRPERASQSLG